MQAFLAVWGAPAIIGWLSGSQPLDVGAPRAALVAGIAAVLAYLWRTFLDPSPIPSLNDDTTVKKPIPILPIVALLVVAASAIFGTAKAEAYVQKCDARYDAAGLTTATPSGANAYRAQYHMKCPGADKVDEVGYNATNCGSVRTYDGANFDVTVLDPNSDVDAWCTNDLNYHVSPYGGYVQSIYHYCELIAGSWEFQPWQVNWYEHTPPDATHMIGVWHGPYGGNITFNGSQLPGFVSYPTCQGL